MPFASEKAETITFIADVATLIFFGTGEEQCLVLAQSDEPNIHFWLEDSRENHLDWPNIKFSCDVTSVVQF